MFVIDFNNYDDFFEKAILFLMFFPLVGETAIPSSAPAPTNASLNAFLIRCKEKRFLRFFIFIFVKIIQKLSDDNIIFLT